jgi:hypothetical protein
MNVIVEKCKSPAVRQPGDLVVASVALPWPWRDRDLQRMMETSNPFLLPENQLIVANAAAHTAVFSNGVVPWCGLLQMTNVS